MSHTKVSNFSTISWNQSNVKLDKVHTFSFYNPPKFSGSKISRKYSLDINTVWTFYGWIVSEFFLVTPNFHAWKVHKIFLNIPLNPMLEKTHKKFFQYSPKFACLKSHTNFSFNNPLKLHTWKLPQVFPRYPTKIHCLKSPTNFPSIFSEVLMLEKSHKMSFKIPVRITAWKVPQIFPSISP